MATFIHGIASSAAIDTAGEVVNIDGIDITSLARTGTITWEHQMGKDAEGKSITINLPAQVVGKILKAKKIFSEKDCSDANELRFWNKIKLPFIYIVAELLDDYTASAKECAGQFRYSRDNPDKQAILGFSIEGSELPGTRVNKMLIMRSIARKCTLTCSPANKSCVAEILDNQPSQVKDEFEEIFKSEANAIQMFKSDQGFKMYETYLAKKEKTCTHKLKKDEYGYPDSAPSSSPPEPNKANASAMQAGATSGGTSLSEGFSNLASGLGFGKSEKKLCKMHKASMPGSKYPSAKDAVGKKPLTTVGGIPKFGPIGKEPSKAPLGAPSSGGIPKFGPIDKPLKKALTAGNTNAAPSTLVNGAAYQTESLAKPSKPEEHNFHGTKKKDWNQRAKEDYKNWRHREKFEKFMSARMPHLAMGEIKAIGRTLALKKNIDIEKSLSNLFPVHELDEKSLKDIQKETANKWAMRAEEAYKKAIELKSVKWLMDAVEYGHEAIEHSSLGEDLSLFEKIKAKLTPLHDKATKLLVKK